MEINNRIIPSHILLLSLVCLAALTGGCISAEPANVNQASSTNSQSNANRAAGAADTAESSTSQANPRPMPGSPVPPPDSGAASESKPPPTLLGTYSVIEVHHKGLIDMISAENTTQINFMPDGRFSRVSKKGGRVDHTDGGDFRVEGQDQLVLVIHESKQKIQDPPVVRKHKIQISPDGTELRMLSNDGKTAMFRRTTSLPGR